MLFGRTALRLLIVALFFSNAVNAQVMGLGREHTELKRSRPAEVYLANATFSVQVNSIDAQAARLTERLKKIVVNGMLNSNRTLREVARAPQILIDCTITKFDFNEKTEQEKVLLIKEKGTFKTIAAVIEVSYKVIRTQGNSTYFADNFSHPFKKKYQVGVEASPAPSEVEDTLMKSAIKAMLIKLTDQDETLKVRLMGKGELDRFAKFAQAKQWNEYIDSITALPERKPDKNGRSEFEADRNYSLAIAYEALAYENMRKDYNRAKEYFELADTAIRQARQFDPRESEYVVAQSRMKQGEDYFKVFKERYPQQGGGVAASGKTDARGIATPPNKFAPGTSTPGTTPTGTTAAGTATPGVMTNDEVITMVKEGLPENLIIGQIKDAKVKQFDVSTAGIVRLYKAQVSEKVIETIKEAMRTSQPPRRKRR
ncbi:MAG: hypothetical protein WBV94_21045 [Blastocatellia bacterium]